MENQGGPTPARVERGLSRVEDLHLDRVVASQPEIGPSPPDGGYGWLIVAAAVVYHITVPGLLTLYSLIMVMAIHREDHGEGEKLKLWDVDIALVPVLMVVIRLLMESWCRAVAKIFNMPRYMAVSGLCLTVAGVLLSSYSSDTSANEHVVNIFAGTLLGIGCALTGQQTELIITHYFRDKLTIAQRIIRLAPSVGNCLIPLLVGYLCTLHTGDIVVMIYGAILMQNCLLLASYTRPVYIEKVIRTTYNMIRDAVEDDDEVIFSNQTGPQDSRGQSTSAQNPEAPNMTQDEDNDVVVFKSKKNAKEILDPAVQFRENIEAGGSDRRFSTDFNTMFTDNPLTNNRFSSEFGSSNRFSSDFGTLDITDYPRVNGYQELESIGGQNPQPLYRGTTVDAPQNTIFPTEVPEGTARRTASLKKNFITVINMLLDIHFYLYALLHLCTTFSILVLGVVFPPLVSELLSLSIWELSLLLSQAHGAALCFIVLCLALPRTINNKEALCGFFCVVGSVGFFGIALMSPSKAALVIWCMCASFATAASTILLTPIHNTLNEFDTTATMTTSNAIVAIFIMAWSLAYSYEFRTCFLTASILQTLTGAVFLLFSLTSIKRRR